MTPTSYLVDDKLPAEGRDEGRTRNDDLPTFRQRMGIWSSVLYKVRAFCVLVVHARVHRRLLIIAEIVQ